MFSLDLRKRVVHLYSQYKSLRKVAIIFQVSHSSVARWLKRLDRKHYVRKVATKAELLVAAIENDPFMTTRKLEHIINATCNVQVSKELVRVVIKKNGYSLKKAKFFGRPKDLEERTKAFINRRQRFETQNRKFVSLDETSFGRNGRPCYGYAPVGKPLIRCKMPSKTGKATSCVVVIDNEGILFKEVKLGSYNSESFSKFLKSLTLPSGTVVMMDNASIHHSKLVGEVANEKGWDFTFLLTHHGITQ